MELLVSNLPYTLMAVGLLVLSFEALAPGGQFMIPGSAILLTGVTSLLLGGLGFIPIVLLIFVYSGIAFYVYKEFDFYGGSGQEQTSSASTLEGTTGRVVSTVTATEGRVKLDKGGGFASTYSARSEFGGEIKEGTEIIVTDPGGGNVLTVMELEDDVDEIDRKLEEAQANKTAVQEGVNKTVKTQREQELETN